LYTPFIAYIFIKNEVRVSHGCIGLWYQLGHRLVQLKKALKLFICENETFCIPLCLWTNILSFDQQTLENLKFDKIKLQLQFLET